MEFFTTSLLFIGALLLYALIIAGYFKFVTKVVEVLGKIFDALLKSDRKDDK